VLADLIQKHDLNKVPPGETVWFQAFGYTIIVRMQRKEPNKDWLQSHPKLRIFDLGISRSKKFLGQTLLRGSTTSSAT
jgi:hypothetical protein